MSVELDNYYSFFYERYAEKRVKLSDELNFLSFVSLLGPEIIFHLRD